MRIVTLLPSATDIVVSLGLEEMLVGVSHECNGYQNKIRKLTSSAVKSSHSSKEIHRSIQDILKKTLSIYKVKFNLLKHLNPDVIITQSQCNVCAVSGRHGDPYTRTLSHVTLQIINMASALWSKHEG